MSWERYRCSSNSNVSIAERAAAVVGFTRGVRVPCMLHVCPMLTHLVWPAWVLGSVAWVVPVLTVLQLHCHMPH
jgi:hypothetical protein